MTAPLHIVLEFARAESAGQPHGFRFAAQTYLIRTPGGGFEAAEFPWSRALLEDLRALRGAGSAPEVVHRLGDALREFLAGAGWSAREQAIVAAAQAGAPIYVTVRSAAAELYALPWELLALKSTGQLVGGIPGLLLRYEWPETASFPDPVAADARRGRVLFAWSAAGGAVPAAEHLAALQAALPGFDPARDVVAHATAAAISAALARAGKEDPPVDALHLLCHGAAAGGTYGLALDDASGPGERVVVDAGRVQQLLAPHAGMLRLVVVAACDSGNVGELGNHLGSVAQMIHRAGLRAVVASRFPLSVAGSSRLCAALYAALGQPGTSLEAAFLAARDALVRDPGQLDWASVQLYARAADGDALTLLPRPAPPPAPSVPRPTPPPRTRIIALGLTVAAALTFALVLALTRPPTDAPTPATPSATTAASTPAPPSATSAAPVDEPVTPPVVAPTTSPADPPGDTAATSPGDTAATSPADPPGDTAATSPVDPPGDTAATAPTGPTPTPSVSPKPSPGKTPIKPKPAPTKSVKDPCPDEVSRFLEGNLKAPPGGGARPPMHVEVRGQRLVYLKVDASYAETAKKTLSELGNARLSEKYGDSLLCTVILR